MAAIAAGPPHVTLHRSGTERSEQLELGLDPLPPPLVEPQRQVELVDRRARRLVVEKIEGQFRLVAMVEPVVEKTLTRLSEQEHLEFMASYPLV